jgi:hypothetical protein
MLVEKINSSFRLLGSKETSITMTVGRLACMIHSMTRQYIDCEWWGHLGRCYEEKIVVAMLFLFLRSKCQHNPAVLDNVLIRACSRWLQIINKCRSVVS